MTARALPKLRKLTAFLVLAAPCAMSAQRAGAGPEVLPKPTDYVSDLAHVLSPHAIQEVDRVCTQLDHSKTDVQIAVVTIPTVNGADIADYARDLANFWGVGRAESKRGVLILLAIHDRKWRIAVSRSLESVLSNAAVENIGKAMVPQLRANDYDDAVMLVVHEIAQAVLNTGSDISMHSKATPPVAGPDSLRYAIVF